MNAKKLLTFILSAALLLSLCACGAHNAVKTQPAASVVQDEASNTTDQMEAAPVEVTVTDMIGRQVTVIPGSYSRVVCVGAGALRMYSYIGDVALLAGVEDIDNTTLSERPMMFDSVARP